MAGEGPDRGRRSRQGGSREYPRSGDRRRFLAGLLAASGLAALPAWSRARQAYPDLIGRLRLLITRQETILHEVARRHDLGILELSAANPGIDPWVPGEERLVVLPSAHLLPDGPREGILINLAELRLYVFFEGGRVETHAIGIGREGFETPRGRTRIVRKRRNPTWYPTKSSRQEDPSLPRAVPPGPDNPLGSRALYLGWPAYLIHGTNKPYGVGRRVSHGCIRMYPEQIERLYDQIPVGTPVTVVEQTVKVGERDGVFWLEAHPDYDQLEELETTYGFTPKAPPASAYAYIRERVGARSTEIDWYRVDAELVARRGYPVPITRRHHGGTGEAAGLY